jgi:exonuclease III
LTALVQEHKLQEVHVADVVQQVGLEGWHITFNCSTAKKGYSGTATLCRWVGRAKTQRYSGISDVFSSLDFVCACKVARSVKHYTKLCCATQQAGTADWRTFHVAADRSH